MSNTKKFSIIIPTLWQSENIHYMLEKYEKSNLVGEIIIIDNNPKNKIDLKKYNKIIYYTEKKNLFVNPSWNIGFKLSSFETILANDDILLDNVDSILNEISNCDFDIVGIDWSKKNDLKIKKINDFPFSGYGCFMYVKNYTPIDENYKIWRGDYILFENSYNKGILEGSDVSGDISKSVNFGELKKIAESDKKNYDSKVFLKNQKSISVIISTYKNIKYLQPCLDSICESGKNYDYEILIGIDGCNETLEYVKKQIFPKNIKFYFFKQNIGHFAVKNSLINLTEYENILFFDSDDLMNKNMIPYLIENFVEFKTIRPGYVNFTNIDNKSNTKYYGEGVFAIKKNLFLKMNGFEPWICAADTEFHNRIRKRNINVCLTKEILFNRRIHNFGLTSRKDTGYGSELRNKYKKIIDSRIKYQDPEKLCVFNFEKVSIKTSPYLEMPKPESEKKKIDLGVILNKQPRKIVENKIIKPEKNQISPDITHLLTPKENIIPQPKKKSYYTDVNPMKTQQEEIRQMLIDKKKNTSLSDLAKEMKNTKRIK